MARVSGIGGIFLRSRDPKALAAWYAGHPGLPPNAWGGRAFPWSAERALPTGPTHGPPRN